MGNLACKRGDLSSAEECNLRAMALMQQIAPDSVYMAGSLNNLGNALKKRWEKFGSLEDFERAVSSKEQAAGIIRSFPVLM